MPAWRKSAISSSGVARTLGRLPALGAGGVPFGRGGRQPGGSPRTAPSQVETILDNGLQSPAATAATLQKDQTNLGTTRTVVGAPASVQTAFSLAQQMNQYLRAGFMGSAATGSSNWERTPRETPLVQAFPRPVQHISNLGNGLAILAGVFGTGLGIAEIDRGQHLQGAKDVTVAGLTGLSGVANLSKTVSRVVGAGFSRLGAKALAAPGEVGVGVGTPIAGLACILGGSFQLVDSLKKHNVEHAVEGSAQIVGGSLLTAGAFCEGTIIGAPAGVVLGAVGGLTLFSQAIIANRKAIARGASWLGGKISGLAHEVAQKL